MKKTIATVIKDRLKEKKWKPRQIETESKRAGTPVSYRTISRIIKNNYEPKEETLRIIAKVLKLQDNDLTNLMTKKLANIKDNKVRMPRAMNGFQLYQIITEMNVQPICGTSQVIKGAAKVKNAIKLFKKIEKFANKPRSKRTSLLSFDRKLAPYFAQAYKDNIGIFHQISIHLPKYNKGYLLNDEPIYEDRAKEYYWSKPPSHNLSYRIYASPIINNVNIEKISNPVATKNYEEIVYSLNEKKWREVNGLRKGRIEFLEAEAGSLLRPKLIELKNLKSDFKKIWEIGILDFFETIKNSDLSKMEEHEYFGTKRRDGFGKYSSHCEFLEKYYYGKTNTAESSKIDDEYLQAAYDQGKDAAELVWKAYLEAISENPWYSPDEVDMGPNPVYAKYIYWLADFSRSKNKEYLDWRLKNTNDLTKHQYELVEFSNAGGYGPEWHYMNNNGGLITEGIEFALDDKDNIIATTNKLQKLIEVDSNSPKRITVIHDSYQLWVEQQKSPGEKNDTL